jgi:hypothetical protein
VKGFVLISAERDQLEATSRLLEFAYLEINSQGSF